MRALMLLILLLIQLPFSPLSYADEDEPIDSAVGAEQAGELAAYGSEEAYQDYESFLEEANEADRSAANALRKAKELEQAGLVDEAQTVLDEATKFAEQREQAITRANAAYEQSGKLAEASGNAFRVNQALTKSDESGNQLDLSRTTVASEPASESLLQGAPTRGSPDSIGEEITRTAKVLTGPAGGRVPLEKGCPDGGTVCFVGDNAQETNGNRAMPTAYEYFKSLYPEHTYAVSTLDELEEIKKKYPPGTKYIGAVHATEAGIKLSEGELISPNSPQLKRMAQIFEGSELTLMACGAARVPGLCSTLAEKTSQLTAYDQKIYVSSTGFTAQMPNTSEHVWRRSGAAIEPGEIVQPSIEAQTAPATYYANQSNQVPERPSAYRVTDTAAPSSGAYSGVISSNGTSASVPFLLAALSSIPAAGLGGASPAEPVSRPQIFVATPNTVPESVTKLEFETDQFPKETNLLGKGEGHTASNQGALDRSGSIPPETAEFTVNAAANSLEIVPSPALAIQANLMRKSELTVRRLPASKSKVARTHRLSPFAGLLK